MLDQLRSASPKTLKEAQGQIDGLWGVVSELESIVTELKSQNEELSEQVRELNDRIGKSSRNSSRAPSSDSTSQRAGRPKKPRSKNRKGAQPGHEKHERSLVPELDVDEVQRFFPATLCGCGGTVSIDSEPRCRHQVFDIPVVRFSVIEHQLFGGQCSDCGKHHRAQTPSSIPTGQMGPNLVALIAHLSGR